MTATRILMFLALFVGATIPAPAATPAPSTFCTSPEYHQFDFWRGNWDVYGTGTTQLAGTNNITVEQHGCVLQEHWVGTAGDAGTSFNLYNTRTKHWHQTWVDNHGGLLLLDGGLANGQMTLSGTTLGHDGKPVTNKITWTPNPNGTVRQVWVATRNGGKTWKTLFDGTYKKHHTQ